jgi:hypothetical protein
MSKRRLRRIIAGCALVLGAALSVTGCTHVKPYQREYLTRPGMDLRAESHAAEFEAHVQSAREGAIGGRGTVESTGGGCGCN